MYRCASSASERSTAAPRSSSPRRLPVRKPVQRFLLPLRADAARHALPARLVAEERGDPQDRVDEVGGLAEDHDDAGAERGACVARALERERKVELVGPEEGACGAAE